MQIKQILFALSTTTGFAFAAPQGAEEVKNTGNLQFSPNANTDSNRQIPYPTWTLTGYSTRDCSQNRFQYQSPPSFSNNLVQGCEDFDPGNPPVTATFDGNGVWQLYLFTEGCTVSSPRAQGSIDPTDLRCYDLSGFKAFSVGVAPRYSQRL